MNPNKTTRLTIMYAGSLIVIAAAFLLYPSEQISTGGIANNQSIVPAYKQSSTDDFFTEAIETAEKSVEMHEDGTRHGKALHKILGWSTLGMGLVTIGSGCISPHKGHCSLSAVTTGLAVATCVTGFCAGGKGVHSTGDKWKLKVHALSGALATAGFITSLAIAGKEGRAAHATIGSLSALAFAVSIGVLYF